MNLCSPPEPDTVDFGERGAAEHYVPLVTPEAP